MKYHIKLRRDGVWIEGSLYSEDGTCLGSFGSTDRQEVLKRVTEYGLARLKHAGISGEVVLRQDVDGRGEQAEVS